MSVFSLSVSLAGPPTLRSGFWYSEGSVLPQGYMLTLSNFLSRYLTLALGALVGWAASRLWRIGCSALFYQSHTPYPSWEQSQNSIFIVNSRSALDGFFDSLTILKHRSNAYRQFSGRAHVCTPTWGNRAMPYCKVTYVILGVAGMAFASVGLKPHTPVLLALIPCDRLPNSVPDTEFKSLIEASVKNIQQVNTAFAVIDKACSVDFNCTYVLDTSQAKAGTYFLSYIPTMAYPNLTQGGDTTLLVYYIGGMNSRYASYNPIFATKPISSNKSTEDPIHRPESSIVPIICDTKNNNTCSELSGFQALMDWLASKKDDPWGKTHTFFGQMFGTQLMCYAAIASSAMQVAQSKPYGLQISPEISIYRYCLILTASYAQLSMNGYLGILGAPFRSPDHPESLCHNPVLPYVLFMGFSILIVTISYGGSLPFTRNMWALHLPGQLHKKLTKKLNGKDFKVVDTQSLWPNAPFASGPITITRKGVKELESETSLSNNQP
ncbi:hypothetical protein CPB86DRAFT_789466 [Serendipita vermifera]|nr:hypothetical protein CPB86DRAFT_789466 [Serendipita vermifera]